MLLLSGRLAPPRLPNALVERERLLTALDGALSTPLTLLSASAGWGKTTLLSAWAHRHTAQVAWLSLDELDNSPTRFWVALIAALRRCRRSATELWGNRGGAAAIAPAAAAFLHAFQRCSMSWKAARSHPAPIVLILDDYQVIEEPAIHQGMSFFLEHLPAHLHLILSSRVDPDLPLARSAGARTADRDPRGRSALPGGRGEPVSGPDALPAALGRGGAAACEPHGGLDRRLAPGGPHHAEARGSRSVPAGIYRQPALSAWTTCRRRSWRVCPRRVRDFLLHTAILSRLDASVCQAVTAAPTREASQQMLVFLERANLFLVPLDEERRWYRLHDLFREALLALCTPAQPEMVPLLHRRAASFYEAQGEWAEAIAHRLAAADFSTAARLMEQTVEQFWVRGEAATMASWVLALPEPLVGEHARLALTTALYLLNTVAQTTQEQRERRYQQARQLMARVEAALQHELDATSHQISATRAEAGAVSRAVDREASRR